MIHRGLLLVLLGIIVNNGLQIKPLAEIRFPSVLGRIGLGLYVCQYHLFVRQTRTQIVWFTGLLVGYWLLLKFTAAPDFAPGDLTMEGNIASYIDRSIIPGKLYLGIHDPEGLVSTIPAISTGLAGHICGQSAEERHMEPQRKALYLALPAFYF